MSAQALREAVMEGFINWQSPEVTDLDEFQEMNHIDQIKDMHYPHRAEQVLMQMWMLFWAEFFDSEEVK